MNLIILNRVRICFLLSIIAQLIHKSRTALSTLDTFTVSSSSSTDTFHYWTFNPAFTTIPFLCGSNYMLGGTGFSTNTQYMERTYSGLGAHFQIKVSYSIYKLDFTAGQTFKITWDTTVYTTAAVGNVGSSQCGGAGNEASVVNNFVVAHTADTLKIRIEPGSAFSSWGVVSYTVEIDECNTNCYRCATTAVQCTSCASGYYLDGSAKTCGTTCPSGKAGNNGTRTCDTNCYYSDEYVDPVNFICKKCNSNCETCQTTAVNCLTCKATYYLDSSTHTCSSGSSSCPSGKKGRNSTRTCDTTCENTNEFSDDTKGNVCYLCNSNCLTCDVTSIKCLTCASPRYLDGLTNTCTAICPAPYWGRNTTRDCGLSCTLTTEFGDPNDLRICKICNANCKTCLDISTSCTSCNIASQFLDLGTNSACVTACTAPFWGDPADKKCKANCPLSNQYGDPADRICKTCNANCQECVDSDVKCTKCSTGYLNPNTNTCDTGCPSPIAGNNATHTCDLACANQDEFFDESDNRICKKCNSNCLTCVTRATNCLTCPQGLPKYYLNDNGVDKVCVTICPIPKWARKPGLICENSCTSTSEFGDVTLNRECNNCDSTKCKSCIDKADYCLSCTDITKTVLDGKCESSCIDGKWLKVVDDTKTCEACDLSCLRCTDGTNKGCVACKDNTYLLDGVCGSSCPEEGYFKNLQTKECVKCENCLTCSGPLANNCLKCNKGDYFLENQCYSTCPKPFYPDKLNINCITHCPSQCLDCDASGLCYICNPGYYRQTPENRTCTTCTEPNQFQNKTNQTCTYCSDSCSKCETSFTCLNCNTGYYLNSVKKCVIKKSIGISVVPISNPFLFLFKFDQPWPELFEMLKNRSTSQFSIWIDNNKTLNFSFSLSKGMENNSYYVKLTYFNVSPTTNTINFEFGYPVEEKYSRFVMNQSHHPLPLREIVNCTENYYYNYTTSKCEKTLFIENSLDLTRKADKLKLTFSEEFKELFDILPNITLIGIENLNDTQFNYTVTQDPSIKTLFHIHLIYESIVLSRPLLTMVLDVPTSLRAPRERAITNYNFSLNLMDYYELSVEEEDQVDKIWTMTEYIYNFYFPAMFFTLALLTPGNSFAIRGTITFYCMHYMKLIAASYPPYATALFDSEFLPFNLIPEVNIMTKDGNCELPRGSLRLYGMECYLLDSLNSFLLLFGIVVLITPIFLLLRKLAPKKLAIFMISRIFVWNLLIVFTLGFSLKYLTHGLITLKYKDLDSTYGIVNFVVALCLLIFYVFTFLSVRKKVSDYRDIFFDELETFDYNNVPNPNQIVPTRDQSLIGSPSKSLHFDENDINSNVGGVSTEPYPALSAGTIANRRASRVPTTFKNISKAMTRLSRRISESLNLKKVPGDNKRISMKFNMAQKNLVEDPFENTASYVTVKTIKTVQNQILNLHSLSEEEYELYLFSNKFLIFSRDFKMTFFFPSYFLLFDQVRFFIIAALLATEESSLYKLFTVNFLNSIMFLYLILARPFKSRWHFAQHFSNDILKLIFGALCFALYWFDAQDDNNPVMRLRAGIGMVAIFYMWVASSGIFLLVELIRVLRLALPQISAARTDSENYSSLRTDKITKAFQETKTGKNNDFTLGNEDSANNNLNNNFTKSVVIQEDDASKGLLTPKVQPGGLAVESVDNIQHSNIKKSEPNPFAE